MVLDPWKLNLQIVVICCREQQVLFTAEPSLHIPMFTFEADPTFNFLGRGIMQYFV